MPEEEDTEGHEDDESAHRAVAVSLPTSDEVKRSFTSLTSQRRTPRFWSHDIAWRAPVALRIWFDVASWVAMTVVPVPGGPVRRHDTQRFRSRLPVGSSASAAARAVTMAR